MPCADASSAAFPRDGASAKRSCISGEPGPKPRQRHPTNPAARRRLAATARGGRFRGTQTGMLHGMPWSARCVQRFDDSRNSAIHITYRVSLRSSSMGEPRDPLSKVVLFVCWPVTVQRFPRSYNHTSLFQEFEGKASKRKLFPSTVCTRVCGYWCKVGRQRRFTRSTRRPYGRPLLSLMILLQVHLQKPCYDFYFL